ncbi:MAG TPA: hypothetical protein VNW26_05195 [Steroidobacteraceae bacterium]|jgi:hypothetical protein|nr:hypothetical protein [Steroidobacteraceae bacterium]
MHWKPHLPEIFLGISLGMIAVEAALSREAAGLIFGPPGWRADGQGLTSENIRAGCEARHEA